MLCGSGFGKSALEFYTFLCLFFFPSELFVRFCIESKRDWQCSPFFSFPCIFPLLFLCCLSWLMSWLVAFPARWALFINSSSIRDRHCLISWFEQVKHLKFPYPPYTWFYWVLLFCCLLRPKLKEEEDFIEISTQSFFYSWWYYFLKIYVADGLS